MLALTFLPKLTRPGNSDAVLTLPDGRVGVVRVVGIKNGHVKLGFEFPKDVDISRKTHASDKGLEAIGAIDERVSETN